MVSADPPDGDDIIFPTEEETIEFIRGYEEEDMRIKLEYEKKGLTFKK